ncbi:uncharacterized protein LOC134099640 [Sardina pilchardus]|uniref:uncharacterized protein LOC134099640 n=1 Tax=Sardina pilchardus TaxID=27697 RepID=UPI002E15A4B9
MEITFKVLKFMLLSGPWWMSDQIALASPFPLCEWNFPQKPGENDNTANHRLRVNCSGLGLGSVPSALPSQMKALDLSYNNITEIKWFDFTHDSCHVTELILSHNSLGKIDGGALSSLLGLKELNLSSNTLAVVTEDMFRGLRDLKVLDLRHNQLHWIHKMAFIDLANLEVLWLQNNNLRTVPDAVNVLTGLNTLSLGTNQLSQLQTGDLNRCTELKILQLEDNQISILAAGTFQNHENLRTVDLSSNRLEEFPDTMVTLLWERGVNLHLHGNSLRCGCGSGQTGEGPAWLTDTVLCQGIGPLQRERAPLRVHTTVTLTGVPGQSLMMPCEDNHHGGIIKYWKTPIGWLTSRNSCHSYSDMKCHCNGSLTIVNISCHLSGLYYCFKEDSHERGLFPYRVLPLGTCQNPMPKSRLPRELKAESQDTVSDSHFVAAVTSSVLVTFIGGFALGAFSRSHLITCLQKTKSRLRFKRGERSRTSEDNTDQISMETSPSGFTSYGDGDAPSITPSPPTKAPRSFRSKREQPEDSTPPKDSDNVDVSNSAIPVSTDQEPPETDLQLEPPETDLQLEDPETDLRQEPPETDLQQELPKTDLQREPPETDLQLEDPETDLRQEPPETDSNSATPANADQEPRETDLQPKAPVPPRPTARRSRVIKLYNYNEDGEHYSHIRDPEVDTAKGVPQPKQRIRSLSRLNAIMSSVETPALSTNTGPHTQSDQESELGHSSEEEESISGRQHIE